MATRTAPTPSAGTATVSTRGETRLYALERDHFLAAVTGHVRMHRSATALAEQRLEELRALREAEVLATTPTPP